MELASVNAINQNKKAKIERQNSSCQFGIALLKEKKRFKYAAFRKGLGLISKNDRHRQSLTLFPYSGFINFYQDIFLLSLENSLRSLGV